MSEKALQSMGLHCMDTKAVSRVWEKDSSHAGGSERKTSIMEWDYSEGKWVGGDEVPWRLH